MSESTDYLLDMFEKQKEWESYLTALLSSLFVIGADVIRYYVSGERFIGVAVTGKGFGQVGFILIFMFLSGVISFWITPKNAWQASVITPILFFILNSLVVSVQAIFDQSIITNYVIVYPGESVIVKYWIVVIFSMIFFIFALFIPLIGIFLFGYLVGTFIVNKIKGKV